MTTPPLNSTLFPYTTLFRSRFSETRFSKTISRCLNHKHVITNELFHLLCDVKRFRSVSPERSLDLEAWTVDLCARRALFLELAKSSIERFRDAERFA